jgi:hypothetical protein
VWTGSDGIAAGRDTGACATMAAAAEAEDGFAARVEGILARSPGAVGCRREKQELLVFRDPRWTRNRREGCGRRSGGRGIGGSRSRWNVRRRSWERLDKDGHWRSFSANGGRHSGQRA